jgi:hypothetical protein
MAAARNCPRTSVGQSPPHRPSCDSPLPPSPRSHRHRCLASHRGLLPLGLDPTPAPRVHVPLFPAPGANPETGLLPPRYQYGPSGNFFKKSFPGKYPPRMGPRAKNFNQFWPGNKPETAGSQIPLKKACTRFCGVSTLRLRALAPGWGSLWLDALLAGKVGQGKSDGTRAIPQCLVSAVRSHRNPTTREETPFPQSM